mgnify:CR=1 FL=1
MWKYFQFNSQQDGLVKDHVVEEDLVGDVLGDLRVRSPGLQVAKETVSETVFMDAPGFVVGGRPVVEIALWDFGWVRVPCQDVEWLYRQAVETRPRWAGDLPWYKIHVNVRAVCMCQPTFDRFVRSLRDGKREAELSHGKFMAEWRLRHPAVG